MADEPLDLAFYRERYERYREVVGLTSPGGIRQNYIGDAAHDVLLLVTEVERLRALSLLQEETAPKACEHQGGEWAIQTGTSRPSGEVWWSAVSLSGLVEDDDVQRRVWYGPTEPIEATDAP